jgi:hypothetical protein
MFTGFTFLIYFPAGMAQLRAVPASSPSEDQSCQLLSMNIELDSSTENIQKSKDTESVRVIDG